MSFIAKTTDSDFGFLFDFHGLEFQTTENGLVFSTSDSTKYHAIKADFIDVGIEVEPLESELTIINKTTKEVNMDKIMMDLVSRIEYLENSLKVTGLEVKPVAKASKKKTGLEVKPVKKDRLYKDLSIIENKTGFGIYNKTSLVSCMYSCKELAQQDLDNIYSVKVK